jgi:nitrate/nitrite transporter NarK
MIAPAIGGFIFERFGPMAVIGMLEMILLIDLVLRILIIEPEGSSNTIEGASVTPNSSESHQDEHTPLMGSHSVVESSRETDQVHVIFRWMPILNCFEDPSVVASFMLTIVNAGLIGAFNATIPLHGKDAFGFEATGAGLLLLPIAISRVIASPMGGRLVDRVGCRKVATVGYGLMTFGLSLFPAISFLPRPFEIAIFGVLLALCGTGLAVVGPGTWVESMTSVQRYHAANPHLFWEDGPYASLQALNMMNFQIGLAIGPIIAGGLRDW